LFLTLKKVLNEDETRRRKETDEMNIMYGAHSNSVLPIAGKNITNQHFPQDFFRLIKYQCFIVLLRLGENWDGGFSF
jgi:hypothetical protein